MDFSLNDDQQMLSDLVDRYIEKDYSFDARKVSLAAGEGFSRRQWQTMAEIGLLGLNVPQEFGGTGGTPVDTMLVMEVLGRGLVVEPFVHTAVVAADLLAGMASDAQKHELLPKLASGVWTFAPALLEPAGRYDLWHVDTRAVATDQGWTLNGAKCTVPFGDSADFLLVPARTSGASDDAEGISLFLVERSAAGVQATGFCAFDGHRVAEINLRDVHVGVTALIGEVGQAFIHIEQATDYGIAAICAESVGVMQRLLDLTSAYLRDRKQFGKPLGSFQSLQHRAAEMVISIEQARSAALMAAARLQDDPIDRRRTVSAAKWLVGRCGRQVGEAATQLHGGMGMTDEMLCGHYFKRLVGIDKTWGDSEHHAELFAQVMDV